jgi:hypothetical protein
MSIRIRKLIGLLAILLWLIFYITIAAAAAGHILPDASGLVAFAYYAVAGLAWTLPLMPLIRWMQRPDPPAPHNGG